MERSFSLVCLNRNPLRGGWALAMASYFPGGLLADRFSARRLITAALVATACGGIYFATIPTYRGMIILSACWGVTTILLFWGALIRATREWGGHTKQGEAFGVLDGGRGLLAALMASGAYLLFRTFFPENVEAVTDEQRVAALRSVILVYTAVTGVAAVLAWLFIPERHVQRGKSVLANAATSCVINGSSCIPDTVAVFRAPRVNLG